MLHESEKNPRGIYKSNVLVGEIFQTAIYVSHPVIYIGVINHYTNINESTNNRNDNLDDIKWTLEELKITAKLKSNYFLNDFHRIYLRKQETVFSEAWVSAHSNVPGSIQQRGTLEQTLPL